MVICERVLKPGTQSELLIILGTVIMLVNMIKTVVCQ